MYLPLHNSHLNGSSVINYAHFSSELTYQLYKLIPFSMQLNDTILEIDAEIVDPLSVYGQSKGKSNNKS